jgi:protease-4
MKESIIVSAIRSFFNAFLAMIGVLIGFGLLLGMAFSFSSPIASSDNNLMMEILPDANGNTDLLSEQTPVILEIPVQDVIGDSRGLNAHQMEKILRMSRKGLLKNNRVKAILLNIDSPGGVSVDAYLIYQALMRYKEEFHVPVYAYSSSLCASAAYMIACTADKINVSPVSITGSVGVLMGPMFNFSGLMDKLGISQITLSEGKNKIKFPKFSKETEGTESYKDIIALAKENYEIFLNVVSGSRSEKGLTKEALQNTYGANVYSGSLAKEYGYVDNGSSSYRDTLIELAQAAGLNKEPYQVVRFYHKLSPIQELMTNSIDLYVQKTKCALLGIPFSGKHANSCYYLYDPSKQ